MKGSELYESMTQNERKFLSHNIMSRQSPSSNEKKCTIIPKFVRSYKVELKLDNFQQWRLFCECHFDDRVGLICRHKFSVYEAYLAE